MNLATGEVAVYVGISPRQAVVAAYAQETGDWNTADYAHRYDPLVRVGQRVVTLGDWTALR